MFSTWVKLPRLPLQCWTNKILRNLGDSIGKTLDVNYSHKTSSLRMVENILVEVDIKEGLVDNIKIIMGAHTHKKIMDYMRIPLICVKCHSYRHVADECSFSFTKKV
jgi:hypothetical protein